MRKVFADWMLLVGLALLFLLACGSFVIADDGSFQAAQKVQWEWRASDYGGATLFKDGEVAGVWLGTTYFAHGNNSWTQADLPPGAPKPPETTPGVPPGTPAVSATVAVGNCGASATAYAQADAARFPRVKVFIGRLRHPLGGRFALRGGCG